jgi:hypothetical protein
MDDEERLNREFSRFLKDERSRGGEIDPYLSALKQLEILRAVPDRDPQKQTKGREAFLQQAKTMSLPVSKRSSRRLNGWKSIFKKERLSMTTVMGIVLTLVLAFGGVGTTAYAAQDSLPSESLYSVKQLTEQVRLALTTDQEAEVSYLLDLAEERLSEIETMTNLGNVAPLETSQKLEEHLQLALSNCAQLGDPELKSALERLHNMSQIQLQTLQDLEGNAPEGAAEGLGLAIRAMNRARDEAADGLSDPAAFRLRQGTNRPEDAPQQPDNDPADQGNQNQQPSDGSAGGQGQGAGGANDGDAAGDGSGDGYGDGSGDGGGAYGDGYGDGSGDGGGAYGPGNGDGTPCDGTECTPQGSGNGSQGHQGGGGMN